MGHHYVPQAYLRAFATPEDHRLIWMYDRRKHEWSRPAIAKAAQQRGYFTPEVESQLEALVERRANVALGALRAGRHWTPEHRRALALYLAVMIRRVPRQRRRGMELLPEALNNATSELKDQVREIFPEGHPRRAQLLEEIDTADEKFRSNPPENVLEQIRDPRTTREILDAIAGMAWRFVPRPSQASAFITSDNPAFYFDGYGVGKPESELTFPVSPELALMGSHQGPAGRDFVMPRVPVSYAKEINRRIVVGAERFVFSSRPFRWIETLANRGGGEPRLNRIIWPPV